MKKTTYAVLSLTLFLSVTVPHAHAAIISSQEDYSGAPSHYWHSDGVNGAYLVTDPADGQPGYSLGDIATTTSAVLGIHLKLQVNTDQNINTLFNMPNLYDESGNQSYACSQPNFQGFAYGSAQDAATFNNPLQNADYNGKMVDMYFTCATGSGHDDVYPNTSYRLYLYPISTAHVNDIYVATGAGGVPYYEISADGMYPPPPAPISISVPVTGSTYFSTDTIIPEATFADLASYTSVVYLLDGSPVSSTDPLPISSLPSGTSTLVIAATDSLGNTTYATSTFFLVNNQPPVVTIATPVDGHSYLQNDTVFVSATASSSNAIATTTYALNGTPVSPDAPLPLMSQPLGTATLVVAATDIYGSTGYATSTFTLLPPDLTPPTVTITSPAATATYTDTSNVLLTATITDASAIAATSSTFTDSAGNTTSVNLGQPLPLLGSALGPASVSVTATDAYGNVTVATVNFTIKSSDVIPPTIVISSPVAGATYLTTDTVYAVASITDSSGIATSSYTLDGISVASTTPLPLDLAGIGPATLVVYATDNFGNTASSSVSFTVASPIQTSTQLPVVVITSPLAGHLYTRGDTVFLADTITSPNPIANVRYYFNGQQINPKNPLPLKTAPLGNANVTVIATDKFGNVGSSTVKFRIGPGDTTCVGDITDAFDHKWISNKSTFEKIFNDCQLILDREHDRDNYQNYDTQHHKDPGSDNNYQQCSADINNAFADIDKNINH